MSRMALVPAWLALAGLALSQDDPRFQFEVATIKLNKSGDVNRRAGILPSGQFAATNMSMQEILQFAFDVREGYVINAPAWTRSDHYDLVGKAGAGATEDAVRPMLRNFLAKDFKLAYHPEERTKEVFVLTVGKNGPKLQAAAGRGAPNCQRAGAPVANGQQQVQCKNFTMKDLADWLPRLARAYVDRDVVDQTGIRGEFDLRLEWTAQNFIADGGFTMPEAVETQLGLKLDQKKLSMPVVVIDRLERLVNDDQ